MNAPGPDDSAPALADASRRARARGVMAAVAAYLAWGLFPIYFKLAAGVPPPLVLAHRMVWSMAFLAVVVTLQRRWRDLLPEWTPRRLGVYAATTLLISANWLLFIWAVSAGRVLEASLGYFVNPLVSVLLGAIFLHERLSRPQRVAVAVAGAGVLALVVRLGTFPWVSLLLALTFGLYGLLRKRAHIDAVVGLLLETILVTPLAAGYVAWVAATGEPAFGPGGWRTALVLIGFGVITPLPLVWFAVAVRRLRLATMGLLQYIAPTCQFVLAVALYREPFTATHGFAFACIWTSLALYTVDALRALRPPAPEPLALD